MADNHPLLEQSDKKMIENKITADEWKFKQKGSKHIRAMWKKTHTLFTLLISKCRSNVSCLILLGKFPSKLATIFQPEP